jgi:hypothetical protein
VGAAALPTDRRQVGDGGDEVLRLFEGRALVGEVERRPGDDLARAPVLGRGAGGEARVLVVAVRGLPPLEHRRLLAARLHTGLRVEEDPHHVLE